MGSLHVIQLAIMIKLWILKMYPSPNIKIVVIDLSCKVGNQFQFEKMKMTWKCNDRLLVMEEFNCPLLWPYPWARDQIWGIGEDES
jgi:hypothetical protein